MISMNQIELFVGLKIPDTTAITAFHTLERMGYKQLKNLQRKDYYKFNIEGSEKDFKDKISKVDILINANKNNFEFELKKENKKNFNINVLIKNIDNVSGLLSTLRERLGFKNIKKIERGVLWILNILAKDKKEEEKIAEKIKKDLVMNENYQEYCVI